MTIDDLAVQADCLRLFRRRLLNRYRVALRKALGPSITSRSPLSRSCCYSWALWPTTPNWKP
jgi:hypothetical protein